MQYDDAGNLKTDTYTGQGQRTYDAENRMTGSAGASPATYHYDGDGRRVKRIVDGVETWQVYGLGGELLAEYAQNAAAASPQKEYGYRNGQLLITATAGTSWGSAPTFANNPLVVGETTVQALHITQLRQAINDLRGHLSLPDYTWVYSATTNDYISANPILEMRTALDQALGAPSPAYAPNLAQGQPIKAIHIQELRTRVLAAWSTGTSLEINWLVADHLGTPRMIFDQTGSLATTKRHDYLPFGEELTTQGGRNTGQGYAADNTRQKFTSKERDNETGLDYFGARYYGSTQGRFTSVDPIKLTTARLYDPQRINLFVFCRNNPIKYLDPDGQDLVLANNTAMERGRANIDARLRADERANVKIVGNKVLLKDRNAVNLSTATNAYKGLVSVIENPNIIVNYNGLKPGESAKLPFPAEGKTGQKLTEVNCDYVRPRGGWGTVNEFSDGTTQYDVYVPVADDVTADGVGGTRVPMPESIIFYHEAVGHPQFDDPGTINFENLVRQDAGVLPQLPVRTGFDHDGIVVRPEPELIPVRPLNLPPLEPVMRPIRPL